MEYSTSIKLTAILPISPVKAQVNLPWPLSEKDKKQHDVSELHRIDRSSDLEVLKL